MEITFSVVIINYNGVDLLLKTLQHIYASSMLPEKVIVVDDASSDGSVQTIREVFPYVQIIQHEINRGPVAARNTGAKEVSSTYIVFMDNDVLVHHDTFEKLLHAMTEDTRRAIVSPLLMQGKDPMWWNAGYDLNYFRSTIGQLFLYVWMKYGQAQIVEKLSVPFTLNLQLRNYRTPQQVDWVAEGCNCVRRDAFLKVKGFDEGFFMTHEGPDICRRLRNIGYHIVLDPRARVELLDGHTHTPEKRKKWARSSSWRYFKKHTLGIRE